MQCPGGGVDGGQGTCDDGSGSQPAAINAADGIAQPLVCTQEQPADMVQPANMDAQCPQPVEADVAVPPRDALVSHNPTAVANEAIGAPDGSGNSDGRGGNVANDDPGGLNGAGTFPEPPDGLNNDWEQKYAGGWAKHADEYVDPRDYADPWAGYAAAGPHTTHGGGAGGCAAGSQPTHGGGAGDYKAGSHAPDGGGAGGYSGSQPTCGGGADGNAAGPQSNAPRPIGGGTVHTFWEYEEGRNTWKRLPDHTAPPTAREEPYKFKSHRKSDKREYELDVKGGVLTIYQDPHQWQPKLRQVHVQIMAQGIMCTDLSVLGQALHTDSNKFGMELYDIDRLDGWVPMFKPDSHDVLNKWKAYKGRAGNQQVQYTHYYTDGKGRDKQTVYDVNLQNLTQTSTEGRYNTRELRVVYWL